MASWYGVGSIITDPSVFGQFGFAPRGAELRSFAAKNFQTVEATVNSYSSLARYTLHLSERFFVANDIYHRRRRHSSAGRAADL
jgi:hypothetical protein